MRCCRGCTRKIDGRGLAGVSISTGTASYQAQGHGDGRLERELRRTEPKRLQEAQVYALNDKDVVVARSVKEEEARDAGWSEDKRRN